MREKNQTNKKKLLEAQVNWWKGCYICPPKFNGPHTKIVDPESEEGISDLYVSDFLWASNKVSL